MAGIKKYVNPVHISHRMDAEMHLVIKEVAGENNVTEFINQAIKEKLQRDSLSKKKTNV
ncbi:MAG: hypothetical protein GY853_14480 [PVC group bacterium]|nr:hypothetical protein [PVC group bacterium]